MDIKEFIKEINRKIKTYDNEARNPFLEYNYAYNPFKSVIHQTYVWVEKAGEEKKI